MRQRALPANSSDRTTARPARTGWVFGLVLTAMLIGLPLGGSWFRGRPMAPYLAFPPQTRVVDHAPLSWWVFAAMAAGIVWVCRPFVRRVLAAARRNPPVSPASGFPWWGWAGLAFGAAAWVVAWNRFAWAAAIQEHTFTPLWLSFIVTVNALTHRRTGGCMMMDRPLYFAALFPASAAFWWFFEYLNRFVGNWHYTGFATASALEYVLLASLSFSTVLPAVLGAYEWLTSLPAFAVENTHTASPRRKGLRPVAASLLIISAAGLAGIAVSPDLLYPVLWVSPLLILVGLQSLFGRPSLLVEAWAGDWRRIIAAAAAALLCGFFWEMWNWHSLAKWAYSVPYVHAVPLFEMPLLGYAGYLPFGLACLAAGDVVASWVGAPASITLHEHENLQLPSDNRGVMAV